jgi:quinol monooxygenase YgiN
MIFITAKFRVRPEDAEDWPAISRAFTEATRAEPGCLWFDWSRSLDDPTEYVLVEAFRDDGAGAAHVRSEHFRAAQRDLPPHLAGTPRIVNATVPQDDWSELGEMAVDPAGAGRPVEHAEGGRTHGETSVDEALGSD